MKKKRDPPDYGRINHLLNVLEDELNKCRGSPVTKEVLSELRSRLAEAESGNAGAFETAKPMIYRLLQTASAELIRRILGGE
jgi:hypothetical protein